MKKLLLGAILLSSMLSCTIEGCPTITGEAYKQNGLSIIYYFELDNNRWVIVSREDFNNYQYGNLYCR